MKLFMSYRRADSRSFTERVHDRLALVFGYDNIFMDVDDIPAGADFRVVLRDAVASCDVVLVMIGHQWLNIKDSAGNRRLDDANDFVRIEVESSLKHSKLVIPLLVGGAQPPPANELPESMRELAFRNAAQMRHNPDFNRDMERLVQRLKEFERTTLEKAEKPQALTPVDEPEQKLDTSPEPKSTEKAQPVEQPKPQQPLTVTNKSATIDESKQEVQDKPAPQPKPARQVFEGVKTPKTDSVTPSPMHREPKPIPTQIEPAAPLSESFVEPDFQQPAQPRAISIRPQAIPSVAIQGCAGIVTIIFLLPLFLVSVMAFATPSAVLSGDLNAMITSFTIDNWRTLFSETTIGASTLRSALYSIFVSLIATGIAIPTSFGLAQLANRYRVVMFTLFLPYFVIPISLSLPLFLMFRWLGIYNTAISLIISQVTVILPFAIVILYDYFAERNRTLEDAAQVDGASIGQIMASVVLPQARPALIATLTICFILAWNDLTLPFVLTASADTRVLTANTLILRSDFVSNFGVFATSALWMSILPVLLSIFVRRYIFQALSLGAVKSH